VAVTENKRSIALLIIVGFSSPTHSVIPGLKPSFSANPSHRSLSIGVRAIFWKELDRFCPKSMDSARKKNA